MLMQVAHQRAVGEFDPLLLAQPAAELGEGPMGLARQRRIVNDGEDVGGQLGGSHLPGPAGARPVDEFIDAHRIEAGIHSRRVRSLTRELRRAIQKGAPIRRR